MDTLEEVEELLGRMTTGEKAQLLQTVAGQLGGAYPGIESTPGICGGEPCVVRTRIPVWLLEQARHLGKTDREILECFPTLRAVDLANAWAFVRAHRDEVHQQIADNEGA